MLTQPPLQIHKQTPIQAHIKIHIKTHKPAASLSLVAPLALALILVIASCNVRPDQKDASSIALAPEVLQTTGAVALQNNSEIERQIELLLSKMTIEEKITMVSGGLGDGYSSPGIERLGIPALRMTDGPSGAQLSPDPVSYGSSLAMNATWNRELLYKIGRSIAKDVKAAGRNVILGPCPAVGRFVLGGRHFECFGEDPFVAAELSAEYVKGVTQERVLAVPKPFLDNFTEFERERIDIVTDERSLHEIDLPPFEAVIKAGAMALMSSYNKVNGVAMSENGPLINGLLKGELGFAGFVMSDWGAAQSTAGAFSNGLDLEMPTPKFFGDPLRAYLKQQPLQISILDDKVRRILRAEITVGLVPSIAATDPQTNSPNGPAASQLDGRAVALESARESLILLKNAHGFLPLDKTKIKSIAVIGPNAAVYSQGSGSGEVPSTHAISPLQGIKNEFPNARIVYAPGTYLPCHSSAGPEAEEYHDKKMGLSGFDFEFYANHNLSGSPVLTTHQENGEFDYRDLIADHKTPSPLLKPGAYSLRMTSWIAAPKNGNYYFDFSGAPRSRLFLDGHLLVDEWRSQAIRGTCAIVSLRAGEKHKLTIETADSKLGTNFNFRWSPPEADVRAAINAAKKADIAVVVAGLSGHEEGESFDRADMTLPGRQNELIDAVLKANSHTIVVVVSGGPVLFENWKDGVSALFQQWYAGEAAGQAIAEAISGKLNPSGRLPITLPKAEKDEPTYGMKFDPEYPQWHLLENAQGLMLGYRFFDLAQILPEYPFGYGLSYSKFRYSGLSVRRGDFTSAGDVILRGSVQVDFSVANAGTRAGKEVAQIYVRPLDGSKNESQMWRPIQELKGFEKVELKGGEEKRISVSLPARAFSVFDSKFHAWKPMPGHYEIRVSRFAGDIQLAQIIDIAN